MESRSLLGHSDRSKAAGFRDTERCIEGEDFYYLNEAEYWIDKAKHSKRNRFYYD